MRRFVKSQAILEMAIFGSIILMMTSTLLSYTQRMNNQQYLSHEAFRLALEKARDNNASVSYTIFENKRNTSIFSPLKGDKGQLSASAVVYWGVPELGYTAVKETWYKFNEDEVRIEHDPSIKSEDVEEDKDETETEIDISTSTDFVDSSIITKSVDSISAYQGTNIGETITYTVKERVKGAANWNIKYAISQGLGPDGKYSTANLNRRYVKSRRWVTPND